MDDNKLTTGISRIAWGYFYLYFNLNIGTVDLLPSFAGYLLFLSAMGKLEQEERTLSLLRPFATGLFLWHTAQWLLSWIGVGLDGLSQPVDLLVELINLYFHFQLLTDIASIAARHRTGLEARLLHCRTLQTLMLTAICLLSAVSPWLPELWQTLSILSTIAYLIAGIVLLFALFRLKRTLQAVPTDPPNEAHTVRNP